MTSIACCRRGLTNSPTPTMTRLRCGISDSTIRRSNVDPERTGGTGGTSARWIRKGVSGLWPRSDILRGAPMRAIQEPQNTFETAPPRSFRYYAAGAIVHLGLAAGSAALGYGWSGVPLAAAVNLAAIALRTWWRGERGRPPGSHRPRTPPHVLHVDANQRRSSRTGQAFATKNRLSNDLPGSHSR